MNDTSHPQTSNRRRNGRVARLPKPARDLVNRLLSNGVPYKAVAIALRKLGHTISERNISNWTTGGGFLEWQLQQEHALEARLEQDALLDQLRTGPATDLPQVGLQAASVRVLKRLLQQPAGQQDQKAELHSLATTVNLLCRISRELLQV